MVRMRVRPEGFKRLRTLNEALRLDDGDQTAVLRLLDREHVLQVKAAFATHGASVATGPWRFWTTEYGKWRVRNRSKYGLVFMRLLGSYRGRSADQLYKKSTQVTHPDHIALWRGRLRYAFGFRDDVGFMHQHGGPALPKRSLVDKTEEDRARLLNVFLDFWLARVRQVLRNA